MTTIFKTTRLFVQPLCTDDFPALFEMQGNPNVMRYAGAAQDEATCKRELEKVIEFYSQPGNTFWVWAVLEKATEQFVGTCAIINNEDEDNEIGYRLLERQWGKGYGKEIANGLIDYCLEVLNMESLVAYVSKENIGSVRILNQSKLPFRKEFYDEKEKGMERFYKFEKRQNKSETM